MAAGSGIRIGDAERETAATSLREHYARGRLTLEEFQERLDAVFAAKTAAELASVTRDLPHANLYAPPWPPAKPVGMPTPGPQDPFSTGQGSQGSQRSQRCSGARSFGWASLALLILAIFLIAAVWPLGLLPRTLLILLAVLAFMRRIFRRTIRGRRRW